MDARRDVGAGMTHRWDGGEFSIGPVGGDGPALLCLHGLTGTPFEVRPPPALVEEHGFACVGPMLPGHGSNPDDLARTRYSEWTACAEVAFDRLRATHRHVYVMGLSAGGVIALWLAARRDVAGALVLAAPLRLRGLYRVLVPALHHVIGSVDRTPSVLDDDVRANMPGYRRMPLSAVAQLIQLQSRVEGMLGDVVAPLRLLYSRHDPTVPFFNAALLQRLACRSETRLEVLERSSHVITVDVERERVSGWILRVLLELDAHARRGDASAAE